LRGSSGHGCAVAIRASSCRVLAVKVGNCGNRHVVRPARKIIAVVGNQPHCVVVGRIRILEGARTNVAVLPAIPRGTSTSGRRVSSGVDASGHSNRAIPITHIIAVALRRRHSSVRAMDVGLACSPRGFNVVRTARKRVDAGVEIKVRGRAGNCHAANQRGIAVEDSAGSHASSCGRVD